MNYKLLIDKALNEGFSDFEIYASKNTSTTLSLFNGQLDKTEIKDSLNYTVRGIYNNKMAYLTFENQNEDFDEVIRKLKANAISLNTKEEFEIYAGDENYPASRELKGGFLNVPTSTKVELLKSLEKKVKEYDSRIVLVPYCRYNEIVSAVEIVNSKGLNVKKENEYCYVILQAVAKENDQTQSAFEIEVALSYDDLLKEDVASRTAKKSN